MEDKRRIDGHCSKCFKRWLREPSNNYKYTKNQIRNFKRNGKRVPGYCDCGHYLYGNKKVTV